MTTVRITGMTCSACERRVERALAALPGVDTVTASATRGRAVLTGTPPSDDALRAALEPAGYHLGTPPWLARDRRSWLAAGLAAVALAGAAGGVVRLGLHLPVIDAGADGTTGRGLADSLALALLVGLAAGVSTCMALVGGLVLGISTASGARMRPHLVFTLGRLAGFALGGALLGWAGGAFRLPDPVVAASAVVVAAVMGLLGLRLTGLSPRVSGWSLALPGHWGDRVGGALGGTSAAGVAGAATFLLPCGFTQAMQLYAVSLASPLASAATMTAFAVGTAPGLLGLGALGGLARWRERSADAVRIVGVVVLAFAVVTGLGGLRALGLQLPRFGSTAVAAPTTVSPNVRLVGDVQVVAMTQTADGYTPARTTVWAGVPIRWDVEVTTAFSCASYLRIPTLGIKADLTTKGRHLVDVPALKVGTTRFTCVMGMYDGTFEAIPTPGGGAG